MVMVAQNCYYTNVTNGIFYDVCILLQLKRHPNKTEPFGCGNKGVGEFDMLFTTWT